MSDLIEQMKIIRTARGAAHLSDSVIALAARSDAPDPIALGKYFRRVISTDLPAGHLEELFSIKAEARGGAAPGQRAPRPGPQYTAPQGSSPGAGQTHSGPPQSGQPSGGQSSGGQSSGGQPWQSHGPSAQQNGVAEAALPPMDHVSEEFVRFETPEQRSKRGKLSLSRQDSQIALRWDRRQPEVPGHMVVYLVCARRNAPPTDSAPSTRIALTRENRILAPGELQFFKVYAFEVADVAELETATALVHADGRILPEVQDLHVEGQVHGAVLTWLRPKGVARVTVLRSFPDEFLDGFDTTRIVEFEGADGFVDRLQGDGGSLQPGRSYQYLICTEAQFQGQSLYSNGIMREVTIPNTPTQVTELTGSIIPHGRNVGATLRWPAPSATDEVQIYWQAGTPQTNVAVGEVMSHDRFHDDINLSKLGTRVRQPSETIDNWQGLGWLPLTIDKHAPDQRFTFTAVTHSAGQYVIGANVVIPYVGDIGDASIDERVDWQIVRASWPSGANFLEAWCPRPGEPISGEPNRRIDKAEFTKFGGIPFYTLPPQGCDVVVRASTRFGDRWAQGAEIRVNYPGRFTLHYSLKTSGTIRPTTHLQVWVERPDWPETTIALYSSSDGYPLTSNEPNIRHLAIRPAPEAAELPSLNFRAIASGVWHQVGEVIGAGRHDFIRLFALAGGITPIVVDPLPEPRRLKRQLKPPALTCPRCLFTSDLVTQSFRCQGDCEPIINRVSIELDNNAAESKPVLLFRRQVQGEGRHAALEPLRDELQCPKCKVVTHQEVCNFCHHDLPEHWWSRDVLSLLVIGARGTGKTSYLQVTARHLEQNLMPQLGGALHPIGSLSEGKFATIQAGLDSGVLEGGTNSAAGNPDLLKPMVLEMGINPQGRTRALSIFDVAGEDMATAAGVAHYGPAMAGVDMLLMLVDPLQLPGIRQWVDGPGVKLPDVAVPAATVMNNVIRELRKRRNQPQGPIQQRIAVAFSKFDGLQKAAKQAGSPLNGVIGPGNAFWRDPYAAGPQVYLETDGQRVHQEIRSLLLKVGEGDLIHTVESAFVQVRYFGVSALGHFPDGTELDEGGATPLRVGDPLRWLLSEEAWV